MTHRRCLFFVVTSVSSIVGYLYLYYLGCLEHLAYFRSESAITIQMKYSIDPLRSVSVIRSADPVHSTLTLRGKPKFKTGDTLSVTIKLRDGNGRQIRQGGDVLRIWLQEGTSNVTGEIQDHGNGKYTGTVLLPWRGRPTVHVSIANTRQHIRYVNSAIEEHGVMREILAKFVNSKNETAVSQCSPDPEVVGWGDICNLTSINYNVLWYCEKPHISSISCFDWKYLRLTSKYYLSDEHIEWIGSHTHMVLQSAIDVTVNEGVDVMPTLTTPCTNIDRSTTWDRKTPTGFYYNGSWISTLCRSSIHKPQILQQYTKCLSHRHLLIIGDSNSRSFAMYLKRILNLTGISISGPWNQFTYWEQKNTSISVSWTPHETPFYSRPFHAKNSLKPAHMFIDEIGKDNNSIILVHMYAHFMYAKPAVLRTRVRRLRLSVEKLLVRSPNVTVVIKGPHAARLKSSLDLIDYLAPIHRNIWLTEFQGLYHRVVYLNMWDITAGSGSLNLHPEQGILSDMILNFFSYVCYQI